MPFTYTAIVGSRQFPPVAAGAVRDVAARILADPGAGIVSGGATGADHFAVRALLELGQPHRGLIVTPWKEFEGFPYSIRADIERFAAGGGQIEWGSVPPSANRPEVIAGLFGRNVRLVRRAAALAAFPHGSCNGTAFTIRKALESGIPVTVYFWDSDTGTLKQAHGNMHAQIPLFQNSAPN